MKLVVLLLSLVAAQGWASVTAYFNHNSNQNYLEPYRKISRPGDNLEQVILDQIKSAKTSIHLAVMELRLPLVAKALIEKKNQGVDVRIILEHDYNFNVLSKRAGLSDEESTKNTELDALVDVNGDGSFSKEELATRDAIYMLKQAKIKIIDDASDGSAGSGLMHHKFMIIDGKTTLISSANFTLSCIHGDLLAPKSRGNANSMIVVKSAALAKIFSAQFLEMWAKNFGHSKTHLGPQAVTVSGTKITVQFSPTSLRYAWEESVNGLVGSFLAKAQKSINAALFVFSDQDLANVMQKRHNDGVAIGALIEPKFAYREYSELLDMLGVRMLSPRCDYEPGNRPWKNPAENVGLANLPAGDVLHHKFGVVDNKIVIMGSQNWSEAANQVNDETLVVIENKEISDQYTQEYKRLLKKSNLGIPDSLRSSIRSQAQECAKNWD